MRLLRNVFAVALVSLFVGTSDAAVVTYDESVDGTLSIDNLNPTPLGTFGIGTSTVSGSVSNSLNNNRTTDIFTFDIAPGTQLDSVLITNFQSGSNIAFAGLDIGNTFPYQSIGFGDINNDYQAIGALTFVNGTVLFDDMSNDFSLLAVQNGGVGFTAPLGPDTYTMFVQDTNTSTTTYTMAFNVSAIPEPSSFAVLGLASTVVAMRRRRKA